MAAESIAAIRYKPETLLQTAFGRCLLRSKVLPPNSSHFLFNLSQLCSCTGVTEKLCSPQAPFPFLFPFSSNGNEEKSKARGWRQSWTKGSANRQSPQALRLVGAPWPPPPPPLWSLPRQTGAALSLSSQPCSRFSLYSQRKKTRAGKWNYTSMQAYNSPSWSQGKSTICTTQGTGSLGGRR